MTATTDRPPRHRGSAQLPAGWKITPLTRYIGARVDGADLSVVADDPAQFEALRELLLEHKVIFFRDQHISRHDHVRLGERFGELEDHPVAGSDPDHPGLVRIYKDVDSPPERYENAYHTDATWREEPPMGAILRCVECPPVGGDTIWVDMERAYEDLPTEVKARIATLRARHSIEATFGAALDENARHDLAGKFPDAEHPVVRTHPETGRKCLFVNSFTTHFVNFHRPENVRHGIDYTQGSQQLLSYLQQRASIPDYQVRWKWEPDSVAIWDNRNTQHYAVMDYWPAVRRMERAGIRGDRPF